MLLTLRLYQTDTFPMVDAEAKLASNTGSFLIKSLLNEISRSDFSKCLKLVVEVLPDLQYS